MRVSYQLPQQPPRLLSQILRLERPVMEVARSSQSTSLGFAATYELPPVLPASFVETATSFVQTPQRRPLTGGHTAMGGILYSNMTCLIIVSVEFRG